MGIRLSAGGRGSMSVELGDAALAAKYAREAKEAAEASRAAALLPPKIGENGNWQIWDPESGAYADSGFRAVGPAGERGPQGEAGNYTRPADGIPEEDLSQSVQDKLNSGGGGETDYDDLDNKPGINGVTLSGNRTAAQLGLAAAGDIPIKTSQLQNDAGFLTEHQSLAAYRTAAAQDVIDAGKETAGLGLTGAAVGDLVRVAAVDANGKPTSWTKAPLCEVKTNPNLLDNWYFANPVNQRGQTSYSNTGYTIDRWKLTSGSMTIAAGGITLNGTLTQTRGRSIGLPVAASALLSDGTMITPAYDDSAKKFTLTAQNKTIVAVKLELGSEQTLAHLENGVWVLNEIPDYQEELYKCCTSTADSSDQYANKAVQYIEDTGWIDLTQYVNTAGGFAARPGMGPRIRIINGIMEYKGEVYIKTDAGTGSQKTILSGIPAEYMPSGQISSCGVTFGEFRPFTIFTGGGGSIRVSCSSYAVTAEYGGFPLVLLSGIVKS